MMTLIAEIGVALVAALHFWFCILEMFLWQKPLGLKIFKLDKQFAQRSATLAANQGLYNLFLSAGLVWSLLTNDVTQALQLKIFFLGCVVIAGVFGGITVSKRITLVQALPAAITLLLLWTA